MPINLSASRLVSLLLVVCLLFSSLMSNVPVIQCSSFIAPAISWEIYCRCFKLGILSQMSEPAKYFSFGLYFLYIFVFYIWQNITLVCVFVLLLRGRILMFYSHDNERPETHGAINQDWKYGLMEARLKGEMGKIRLREIRALTRGFMDCLLRQISIGAAL